MAVALTLMRMIMPVTNPNEYDDTPRRVRPF
jgi:hypothetical protein